jgi:penicillin-binding protein 2
MADQFSNRQNILRVVILFIISVLFIRVAKLQLFDDYAEQSQIQSLIRKVIFPARGALVDRNGKMILSNTVAYNLMMTPRLLDKNMDTARLCKILNITDSTFKAMYKKALDKELNRNIPIPVFKDLDNETVAGLFEYIGNYQGMDLVPHTIRSSNYNCGGLVIGYTGEVSANMLKTDRWQSYTKGDYVGIAGLENKYEEILCGQRGIKYYTRDNKNRITGSYKNEKLDTAAIPGKDLELFMDIELQQYAEKLMVNKLGSAVAIDPNTGGILAMVSSPSFDPNIVNAADRSQQMYKMLTDPTKPLFNRAVQAYYPPGSTFKPLSALVALDQGVATAATGYGCGGRYHTCGGKIKCTHAGGGHAANLANAMANSCNSYFCHMYKLALDNPKHGGVRKGLEVWGQYMNNFGLGHPLGIDFPIEIGGSIPGPDVYDKMYTKDKWNSCNNAMNGMGQGEILCTPIQLANAMCIIANKGHYYIPHFVKKVGKDSNHKLLKPYLKKIKPVNIDDIAYQAVFAGMEKVVTNGTGTVAKIPGIDVCAKTGTVENYGPLVINGKPVKNKNHSMFVAFAPKDSPKICIAVCIENAGYGATWAGPVASLMIERYLTDTVRKARKGLEHKMTHSDVIPKNIYIVDSLLRERSAAIEARKKAKADSLKKLNIKDPEEIKAEEEKKKNNKKEEEGWFKKLFSQAIIKEEEYNAKEEPIRKG